MKKALFAFLICLSTFAMSPGDTAPNFKLLSQSGKEVELNSLKKPVLLEWYNEGCPYVRKHYDAGNMQKTQEFFKSQTGGTWVSIVSSRKGKQGYIDSSAEAKERLSEEKSKADYMLMDFDGRVGQLYDAKATPQMVYIGKDNKVKYYGAIDSIPSASQSDIAPATNYVIEAVKSVKVNERVKESKTRPYGCSVKY